MQIREEMIDFEKNVKLTWVEVKMDNFMINELCSSLNMPKMHHFKDILCKKEKRKEK